MSDETPRLKLPQLVSQQAMTNVTWNEALVRLDALVDLCLNGQYVNTPPSNPADGDCYIIGGAPTGAWSGYAYKIAACLDGAWRFYTPYNGLRAWLAASGTVLTYFNGTWSDGVPMLGVDLGGTNQTGLTAGQGNKIAFSNVVTDSAGWWDAANKRYTPQQHGFYLALLFVRLTGSGMTSTANADIFKNGAVVAAGAYLNGISGAAYASSTASKIIEMNGTTDYLEGWCYVPTGGTAFDGATFNTYLQIVRMKP